jgi:hypothetical protein
MTPDESIAALKELLLAEVAGLRALIHEKDGRYADLVGVKTQAALDLLKEKDALYTDRDTARQKAVEAALKAAQTGVDAAFAASEKAIGKSDQNAEKWRENANEWRAAMQDREVKFASRIEVDNEIKNLRTELATVTRTQAATTGKTEGVSASWGVLLSVVGLVATLLSIGGVIVTLVIFLNRRDPPVYVPAPAGTSLPASPPTTVTR